MPAKTEAMRVVSGIQPTGGLHLGNLLGAILRWVRMQDEAEGLSFLPARHSRSEYMDPAVGAPPGNLLGAVLAWGAMEDEAQCLYFLADLHSLSEYMDPAVRRTSV